MAVANKLGWIESSNVIVTNWGTSFGLRPAGGDWDGQRQFGSLQLLGSQDEVELVWAWARAAARAMIAVLIPNTFILNVWKEKEKRGSIKRMVFSFK